MSPTPGIEDCIQEEHVREIPPALPSEMLLLLVYCPALSLRGQPDQHDRTERRSKAASPTIRPAWEGEEHF
eukprot:14359669-Heterocapsa_arctica.AAC.1